MPFSRSSPSECRKKSASTSCRVTSLITTVPGSAACWTRAARLGTSPTIESRSATAPSSLRSVTTTRPVWIPTRTSGAAPKLAAELGTGVPHRGDEVEAGEHGAAGVVLVRFRMAEAGEDAVAGVVQQVAAVPGHRVLREAAVGGEEVAQLLGLHLLGQDRRAHQVGEQQRHEGPLTRRAHLAGRDPPQDGGGAAVVGIDGPHLLGHRTGRLDVARGPGRLGGGQQPVEEAGEPRLGRESERGHGLVPGGVVPGGVMVSPVSFDDDSRIVHPPRRRGPRCFARAAAERARPTLRRCGLPVVALPVVAWMPSAHGPRVLLPILVLAAAVAQGFGRFGYALLLPALNADLVHSYAVAGLIGTLNLTAYLAGTLLVSLTAGHLAPPSRCAWACCSPRPVCRCSRWRRRCRSWWWGWSWRGSAER